MNYNNPYRKLPEKYDRRKKVTKKDVETMRRLRHKGWLYDKIGVKFGVSGTAVRYHLKGVTDTTRENNRIRMRAVNVSRRRAQVAKTMAYRKRVFERLMNKRKKK